MRVRVSCFVSALSPLLSLNTNNTHTRTHAHAHIYSQHGHPAAVNNNNTQQQTRRCGHAIARMPAVWCLSCAPLPPSTSRARRLHRYSKSSPGINVVSDVIHRSGSSPPAHPCKRSALCPFGLARRETFGSDRESRWGSGPVALIMTSAACHHLRTGSQPQPLVLVLAQPRPTDSSGTPPPKKPSNGIRAAAQP